MPESDPGPLSLHVVALTTEDIGALDLFVQLESHQFLKLHNCSPNLGTKGDDFPHQEDYRSPTEFQSSRILKINEIIC